MTRGILTILVLALMIIAPIPLRSSTTAGYAPQASSSISVESWSPIDTSEYEPVIVGGSIGSLEGESFAGWYSSTVVVDNGTDTLIVAWARMDADSYNNDYICLLYTSPSPRD